jgi:hypothetical protein
MTNNETLKAGSDAWRDIKLRKKLAELLRQMSVRTFLEFTGAAKGDPETLGWLIERMEADDAAKTTNIGD